MSSPLPLSPSTVTTAYSLQIFRQADNRHSKALSPDQWAVVDSIVHLHPPPKSFRKEGSQASVSESIETQSKGKATNRKTRTVDSGIAPEFASGFPFLWSFSTNQITNTKAYVKEAFTQLEKKAADIDLSTVLGQAIAEPSTDAQEAAEIASKRLFTRVSPELPPIPCSFLSPPQAPRTERQRNSGNRKAHFSRGGNITKLRLRFMKHQRIINSKPKELFLRTGWESRPAQGVPELGPREVRVDLTTFGQTRHASKTWLLR
jgi:hypothetical protein